VYVRNQRRNAPQVATSSNLADLGWAAVHARRVLVGDFWAGIDVAGREATLKCCGVGVARPQGYSWAPTPSNESRVNVGTVRRRPPRVGERGWAGASSAVDVGRGGASVVVRGRESRPHGEGRQRVRSGRAARPGGRR